MRTGKWEKAKGGRGIVLKSPRKGINSHQRSKSDCRNIFYISSSNLSFGGLELVKFHHYLRNLKVLYEKLQIQNLSILSSLKSCSYLHISLFLCEICLSISAILTFSLSRTSLFLILTLFLVLLFYLSKSLIFVFWSKILRYIATFSWEVFYSLAFLLLKSHVTWFSLMLSYRSFETEMVEVTELLDLTVEIVLVEWADMHRLWV